MSIDGKHCMVIVDGEKEDGVREPGNILIDPESVKREETREVKYI